jgi:segregation and condensation protein B
MEISNLIPHVEALIFASEKPLTALELTDLINNAFGFMEDKIGLDQVETSIEAIAEKYQSEFYPFEIRQSGGGWQFLTKKDYHKTVAQLNGEKFLKRLSSASLETLSIIAYKQPVTKAEIESIRGVSSDYAVQKLLEKDLIVITGRNEALPGHPLVYATSKSFMDYFGINSPEDLPKLKEVFDDSLVNPTPVSAESIAAQESEDATEAEETSSKFIVGENGELEEVIVKEISIEVEEVESDGEAADEVVDSADMEEAEEEAAQEVNTDEWEEEHGEEEAATGEEMDSDETEDAGEEEDKEDNKDEEEK